MNLGFAHVVSMQISGGQYDDNGLLSVPTVAVTYEATVVGEDGYALVLGAAQAVVWTSNYNLNAGTDAAALQAQVTADLNAAYGDTFDVLFLP